MPKDTRHILTQERHSIRRCDIPYFSVDVQGLDLILDGNERLKGFFQRAGIRAASERIERLSLDDIAEQSTVAELSLRSRLLAWNDVDEFYRPDVDLSSREEPEKDLEQALSIFRCLERVAFRGGDGSRAWLGVQCIFPSRRYQLGPLSAALYDGYSGIGLFYAALFRITGQEEFRTAANTVFKGFTELYDDRHGHNDEAAKLGPGGIAGLGSILYTLVRVGDLLDQPRLVEMAKKISLYTCTEMDHSAGQTNLMEGTAGLIVGLLTVAEHIGNAHVLKIAINHGQRLFEKHSNNRTRHSVENRRDRKDLAFCTGELGVAYALRRLSQSSGIFDFDTAAHRLIQSYADPARGDDLHAGIDIMLEEVHQLLVYRLWSEPSRKFGEDKLGSRFVRSPGFFVGLAGQGYELLRRNHSEVLPRSLILENRMAASGPQ